MSKLGLKNNNETEIKSNSAEPDWFAAATKTLATTQRQRELKIELDKISLQEEKMRKLHERAKELRKSKNSTCKENKPTLKEFKIKKTEDEEELISDASSDGEDSDEDDPAEEVKYLLKVI